MLDTFFTQYLSDNDNIEAEHRYPRYQRRFVEGA